MSKSSDLTKLFRCNILVKRTHMMQEVTIVRGKHRDKVFENVNCQLIHPIKLGARGWYGNFIIPDHGTIRIQLENEAQLVYHKSEMQELFTFTDASDNEPQESDESIIARIEDRFSILEEVTRGVAQGQVRSLIVSGAPGIGKSAGIIKILDHESLVNNVSYNKISGGIVSAYQLYQVLYENQEPNSVLVLDDSDQILYNDACINLLKAALESGNSPRMISYHSDSVLDLGLPKSFEFQGQIIFITNVDFQRIIDKDRAGIAKHLSALQDRSLYLSLTLQSRREIWCRIKSMVEKHNLLKSFDLSDEQVEHMLYYLNENRDKFRTLSLRTVLQLAQFVKTSPNGWQRLSLAFHMK